MVGLIEQQVSIAVVHVDTMYMYIVKLVINFKVSQLVCIGVPAVHAFRSEQMPDIKAGKFTFGWFVYIVQFLYSFYVTGDHSVT